VVLVTLHHHECLPKIENPAPYKSYQQFHGDIHSSRFARLESAMDLFQIGTTMLARVRWRLVTRTKELSAGLRRHFLSPSQWRLTMPFGYRSSKCYGF
jgi:hypothetical protein